MAPSTSSSHLRAIRHQMTALHQRISWIERALKPKGGSVGRVVAKAQFDRRDSEARERRDAMSEYFEQQTLERYRENPWLFKIAREQEQSINRFLRERGIRPSKSGLPTAKQLTSEPSEKKPGTGSGTEATKKLHGRRKERQQSLRTARRHGE